MLLVFWQVRNFDFINLDDWLYVKNNQHLQAGPANALQFTAVYLKFHPFGISHC